MFALRSVTRRVGWLTSHASFFDVVHNGYYRRPGGVVGLAGTPLRHATAPDHWRLPQLRLAVRSGPDSVGRITHSKVSLSGIVGGIQYAWTPKFGITRFGKANVNGSARRPATIHPLLRAIFERVLDGNHEKCPLLATCNH